MKMGFSPEAAQSYEDMTGTVVDVDLGTPANDIRGKVTLPDHVRSVVKT